MDEEEFQSLSRLHNDLEVKVGALAAGSELIARHVAELISENARLLAENAAMRKALQGILDLKPEPFAMPADWREQIAACGECQGWAKNHPIQQGICDTHRQPLWDRERHDQDEEAALIFRAKTIAKEAIVSLEKHVAVTLAPEVDPDSR